MKGIVRPLVSDEQEDQEAARDANGQPHRVDEEVALVGQQVPQRDDEVVFQHGRYVPCNVRLNDGKTYGGNSNLEIKKGIYGFDPPIPLKVA